MSQYNMTVCDRGLQWVGENLTRVLISTMSNVDWPIITTAMAIQTATIMTIATTTDQQTANSKQQEQHQTCNMQYAM